tara:strand:+ start:1063 stop:1263 length:201 start_codon:yes stop_codon:yes gene_type:complete
MKQSEIQNLSIDALKEKLVENKNKLSELKMGHAISPLENPLQIKYLRKDVARILTAISEKENESLS